jgi:hypothetical protein
VKLECFLGHMRTKRIIGIREGGKFESHFLPLLV